jgi:hypothetical protein
MAISIESDNVVGLTEATKIIPPRNGKRVAISTVWRWCRKGINGVRLEYIRMGRNIATSREAINRFFEVLAQNDKPLPDSQRQERPLWSNTPASRRASIEAAKRELDALGI